MPLTQNNLFISYGNHLLKTVSRLKAVGHNMGIEVKSICAVLSGTQGQLGWVSSFL